MSLPVIGSSTAADAAPRPAGKRHLLDCSLEQLQQWLVDQGQPKFRAKQIFGWVYEKRQPDFQQMSDLPKGLRDLLEQHFDVFLASEAAVQTSRDGTDKLLVRLADGGEVECVLLRDGNRRSICVSSQVGCAMGCVFCASGLDGVDRNLTRGEIVEQMLRLQARLGEGERLSHIVMMGMGEPLANLQNVLGALDAAKSQEGLGISPRRITISTVGLPPAIDRLAANGVPYNLAVSLHAPNEALRDQLVPVNRKIGIDAVLDAADRYFDASGRRLTFEYVLLGDVNDRPEHARQLVQRLRKRTAMLNVIPYNPVAGLSYQTPTKSAIQEFRQILESGGVNVKFRQRKGDEIDAACGQLRRNRKPDSESSPTG
ncbi:23S rRNA (adenine(2503)-C(2))-methyltransferase RlmN [Roseiconus nitratireducens]|uniref:Probable dual-specificity RNA methyltransferase RlmN n=1 Tax=Roseiconus nitratireducens TaxID=2605748 RepID=A0A5M6DIW6_9BACT|nr:23S rRNA (adenine(2503)-C(2))-methyltransferase RlmN [Roseiconus nitratireducens]KAA5546149.1 23S rRNA (adenine(2503)-C(2))-methyltransferase RlmN [Roseiconus nitratireducens]